MKTLKRLLKFCLSALVIYFVGKVPVMLVLTEWLQVHYVLSGAVAGAVVTLLQFIPSEFWIWKKQGGQGAEAESH